jgi:hypothetical protein
LLARPLPCQQSLSAHEPANDGGGRCVAPRLLSHGIERGDRYGRPGRRHFDDIVTRPKASDAIHFLGSYAECNASDRRRARPDSL